jgi:uncharacterized membrane protein
MQSTSCSSVVAARAKGEKVAIVDSDAASRQLVSDYLGRLTAAGWSLAPARREELLAEVREHIEQATQAEREGGNPGEAGVRNVLDRLGRPEEIARAAIEQEPAAALPHGPAQPAPQAASLRDVSTLLLLMFGGFLIGIGWVVGVALLWTSPRWRTRDKWLATLVWPFGYFGVVVVGGIGGLSSTSTTLCTSAAAVRAGARAHETCTSNGFSLPGWLGVVVIVVLLVAPVLVAVRLLRTRPLTLGV